MLFSFFLLLELFWALFGRGWISPEQSYRVGSLDTLESLPPVNMPITTASEAMKFAYEREDVYTWLHRASEEFPSDTKAWDITNCSSIPMQIGKCDFIVILNGHAFSILLVWHHLIHVERRY